MYTSASSLGLESSASENFKPHTMSLVSPRLYWALLHVVGPPVDTALRRFLPQFDWAFLRVRQRRASAKGAASAASEEQWRALQTTQRRQAKRAADPWTDTVQVFSSKSSEPAEALLRPADACVLQLQAWAALPRKEWDSALDCAPCVSCHCALKGELHNNAPPTAAQEWKASLAQAPQTLPLLSSMIGAPAVALLLSIDATAAPQDTSVGQVQLNEDQRLRKQLYALASLPLLPGQDAQEAGNDISLPAAEAAVLAIQKALYEQPLLAKVVCAACVRLGGCHLAPQHTLSQVDCETAQGSMKALLDIVQRILVAVGDEYALDVPIIAIPVLQLATDIALSWQLSTRAFLRQQALSDVLNGRLVEAGAPTMAKLVSPSHAVEQVGALGISCVEDLVQFDAGLLHGELAEGGVHVHQADKGVALIKEEDVQMWLDRCGTLIRVFHWLTGV